VWFVCVWVCVCVYVCACGCVVCAWCVCVCVVCVCVCVCTIMRQYLAFSVPSESKVAKNLPDNTVKVPISAVLIVAGD